MWEQPPYEGVHIGRNSTLKCVLDPEITSPIDRSPSTRSAESYRHLRVPTDSLVLEESQARQRDATPVRTANELAAECGRHYKEPVLW